MQRKAITRYWIPILASVSVLVGMVSAAAAETSPSFAIEGWAIEGNSLLSEPDLQESLKPFIRNDASFDTLKEAVKALETVYQKAGYSAVRVLLPEQDIASRIVRLKVIEASLGRVYVEGNKHVTAETVRASVPGIREGRVPNMLRVANELQVVNDSPVRQQVVILRRGTGPAEVDAVIRVTDTDPLRSAAILDNSGSRQTGRYRIGAVAQHANLFELDHVGSVQVMTSPDHADEVVIAGFGYRLPVYDRLATLDLMAGYSDVDSGSVKTAGGTLNISGKGYVFSIRYNQFLPRFGEWTHRLSAGLDHRFFDNDVSAGGSSLIPDVAVTPASVGYTLLGRVSDLDVSGHMSYAINIPVGSHGAKDDFSAPAKGDYSLWRYGVSLGQPIFGGWQWNFEFSGQDTQDHLVAGEQFGLGGADSVRGFHERAVANDRGHRASLSLSTPDMGHFLGVEGLRLRALWFADGGEVRRNHPRPLEARRQSVTSTGFGVRGGAGKHFVYKADFGIVLNPGVAEAHGDTRVHASLTYLF